ncbi:hypothetical protein R3I94_001665 [Phoxinus phoxinus]
MSQWKRVP